MKIIGTGHQFLIVGEAKRCSLNLQIELLSSELAQYSAYLIHI